jgi:IclR family mhp operon transcriptional activator
MVGRRRSLIRSALGRAILAASPPALRREMLEMTASLVEEDAAGEGSPLRRGHCVSDKKGRLRIFGWRVRGISAIALPIQGGGPVIGSLN